MIESTTIYKDYDLLEDDSKEHAPQRRFERWPAKRLPRVSTTRAMYSFPFSSPSGEVVFQEKPQSGPSSQLIRKLNSLLSLSDGWNGYSAPKPAPIAVRTAKRLLSHLIATNIVPDRIAPSSVGGVGITIKRNWKKVYVEFYNDGRACLLVSGKGLPAQTQMLDPAVGFISVVRRIREYLNGRHSG